MNAETLARIVAPPKGAVAAVVTGAERSASIFPATKREFFECGSLTKTFVVTLLATLTRQGALSFDTTVESILGPVGEAGAVTLDELSRHISGLPRLAPDAMRQPFWPRDPYRFYSAQRLLRVLPTTPLERRGEYAYSNMGIDVLSVCLERATGTAVRDLLERHVFEPAGMSTARAQPCSRRGLARGHAGMWISGGRRWHERIIGGGGVDVTIDDLRAWLEWNLLVGPHQAILRDAHDRAWAKAPNATLWHNGATGAFQSLAVLTPDRIGIGILAAHGLSDRYSLTDAAFEAMRETGFQPR